MNKQHLSGMYGYGWDYMTEEQRNELLYGKPMKPKPNRQQRREQAKLLRSSQVIKIGHKKTPLK